MAGIESFIGPALGFAAGLFGGKPKRNPYAGEIASNARRLAQTRQGYSTVANNAQQSFNQFDPQFKRSVNDYADYLRTDPYNDQYSTRQISRATASTNRNYDMAKSRLSAELARRGITDSGVSAGTLGSIEAGRAGEISSAQNDLALRAADSQDDRFAALANLFGTARNTERAATMSGLSGQQGIDSTLLSTYTGLNSEANQYAAQSEAAQNAALGAAASGIGTATTRRNQGLSQEDLLAIVKMLQGG